MAPDIAIKTEAPSTVPGTLGVGRNRMARSASGSASSPAYRPTAWSGAMSNTPRAWRPRLRTAYERDVDQERGAAPRRLAHRDPAAVLGDDPARDGKSEAGVRTSPCGVCPVEALKHALAILRWNARSVVGNQKARPSRFGVQPHVDRRARVPKCIVEQDPQQLPQHVLVAVDRRVPGLDHKLRIGVLGSCLAAHLLDHRAQVDRRELQA